MPYAPPTRTPTSRARRCASGVLLWNTSGSAQDVAAALDNVPFANGDFRVYRIDAEHAGYEDNPASETLAPVEQQLGVSTAGLTWSGTIPDHGIVYLEAEDGTGTSSLDPVDVGTVVRDLQYMPNHGKKSYASFDRPTWTAEIGMGTETWADAAAGVLLALAARTRRPAKAEASQVRWSDQVRWSER